MKKKTLLICLCMALVAVTSVMGTLAWLTDTDAAVNTFTIGQVDIALDEADVDENGQLILDEEGNRVARVKENEYHLIPGQTYIKDPTVTVQAGSEPAYIRMILTVHNASAVRAIIDKYGLGDFSALIGGWDEETWLYHGFTEDTEKNTISFEFRYPEPVGAGADAVELPALFETLIVPGQVSNAELQALYDGGFQMVVYGHAIQAAGFVDEEAAWAGFDEQVTASVKP